MTTTEETRIEWTGNIQVHHPIKRTFCGLHRCGLSKNHEGYCDYNEEGM